MRLVRRLILLALTALALLVGPAFAQSESFEREARAAFRAGKYKEAAIKFHDAATAAPDNARRAKMELQAAYSHFNDKNVKAARESAQHAFLADSELEIVPEFFAPDFVRMVDELRRSLKPAPTPAPIDLVEMKRVATEKLRDNRADEVIYDLTSIPPEKLDAELKSLLARAYALKGRTAPVPSSTPAPLPPATAPTPALAPRGGDAAELLSVGRAALARGESFTAQSAANRALELSPTSSEAYRLLGDAYAARGDKELAEANWKAALKYDDRNEDALFALADLHIGLKDYDTAAASLRRAAELNAKNTDRLVSLARRLRGEGDLAHARSVFAVAASLPAADAALETEYASLLLQTNDAAAALEPLMKATVAEPKRAVAHANLAAVLRRRGQSRDAEREYREALAADEAYAPALNGLATLLLASGKPGDAAPLFEKAVKADPRNVDAVLGLARAERAAGKLEAAAATLQAAKDLDDATLWNEAGAVAYELGRFAEAAELFDRALARDPALPGVATNRERARKAAAFLIAVGAKAG